MFFQSTQIRRRAIWFAAFPILLGTGAFLLHAFNPQPDPPRVFGIFGVTSADVLRLNVTNIGSAVGAPPDPCRAQIGFVNADGITLKTTNVTIADGHSASIALTFFEALTAPGAVALTQANVRPVINVFPPDPCFTAVSAEIADASTGRVRVYAMPHVWPAFPAVSTNGGQ